MEQHKSRGLHYHQKIKWIDRQLKEGKELAEIFNSQDLYNFKEKLAQKDNTLRINPAKSEQDVMAGKANAEVIKQWGKFTTARNEKADDLLSMALWEFMKKCS